MLMEPLGKKVDHLVSFYAVMIGYLTNLAIPRAGEISRCVSINQVSGLSVDKLIGTIVTERIIDLLMMGLITLALIGLQYDLLYDFTINALGSKTADGQGNALWLGIIAGVGCLFFLGAALFRRLWVNTSLGKKVIQFIRGLWAGIGSIAKMKNTPLFLVYSIAIWVLYFLASFTMFYALPSTSHLGINAGLTVLFMGTIAIIVPAPGGIGSFQYFVPLGLTWYGISDAIGKAYAIANHSVQLITILIFGAISFAMIAIHNKKKANALRANKE